MPTYSYKCTDCGEGFDIQQAFTDDSLTECPNCGGRLRKVFGTIGVTFNGPGFYRTDSRSTSSSSAPAAHHHSEGSSSEGTSTTTTTTEKKTTATPTPTTASSAPAAAH